MPSSELYIGLISGTSADAIDAALVDFESGTPRLLAHHSEPLDVSTKAVIHQLAQPGPDEIDQLGDLDHKLGVAFAQAANQLMEKAGLSARDIAAIGSHGQTLRHRPPGNGKTEPFTLQVADPNLIAHHTGITTVADFRRRDMAAGGHGAPLVPALHHALFHNDGIDRAVINIGGVANVTWLPASDATTGFDTGPGNNLMDAWVQRTQGKAFDADGQWAASGTPNDSLLEIFLTHPFFRLTPPKSTGPEEFHLAWLDECLLQLDETLRPEDVQATLLSLTARTIVDSLVPLLAQNGECEVYLCGGGAHNSQLREALSALLPGTSVGQTDSLGLPADWVEAVAFAWMAKQTLSGLSSNLPAVTGASAPQILGGIYPAQR
ncbi:anhydro-N-acetylmuramic acid kinase [Marinimicrobium locisalis]|uniref:anhydro-N-acetylmuramic acid kinase n=1 Tax=Marinimicrobium locisalis TaxID=546022 RepID=UPI0032214A45